jgi:hypothetical protein
MVFLGKPIVSYSGIVLGQDFKISELLAIVQGLPNTMPLTDKFDLPHRQHSKAWYRHQKEHLEGWLGDYLEPGAYNRAGFRDSAMFFYSHFQCWTGLLWLAEALGESPEVLEQACKMVLESGRHSASQTGAFRRVVPWTRVYHLLVTYQPKQHKRSLPGFFKAVGGNKKAPK